MLIIELVFSILGAIVMLAVAIFGVVALVGFGSYALINERNRMHIAIPIIFCATVMMGIFIANAFTGGRLLPLGI